MLAIITLPVYAFEGRAAVHPSPASIPSLFPSRPSLMGPCGETARVSHLWRLAMAFKPLFPRLLSSCGLIASVRDQTKATQEDGEIKAGALKGWYIRPSGRQFQAFFST